jgi:hypothetical protein
VSYISIEIYFAKFWYYFKITYLAPNVENTIIYSEDDGGSGVGNGESRLVTKGKFNPCLAKFVNSWQ